MPTELQIPSTHAQEIFFAALEISDPDERFAYVERECGGDRVLKRWVNQEIREQTGQGGLLSSASPEDSSETGALERMMSLLRPEEPGETIGRYELVTRLGEGGFGIVWQAIQRAPMRREVALKILKLGLDSRQIASRFEQEEQALAMLDHPGIAKVYDAGSTAAGLLYFAMELIHGETITRHCDALRCSVRERVELLLRVCFAVQHAHQKGVIHRDLKPSNVLVTTLNDGSAAPKVIDFGLAKAIGGLEGRPLAETAADVMIGTPLYMSPEQAEGSPDLDTRADIYALGVLLYELLTGRTPHDPQTLAHCPDEEVRRAIREIDPPPPSEALRGLSEGMLGATAQQRDTLPQHLVFAVRGDLDAICQKALEKDRQRRYSSAAALAADLQRHLLSEPIAARPPSCGYRAGRFMRRHRLGVAASLFVLLSIVVGAAVSLREAWQARRAQRAESGLRMEAESQRANAERLRARAELNGCVADVGQAQQSLVSGNLGRAAQLLAQHVPNRGERDLRGWGWRYLWGLSLGGPHRDLAEHSGPASTVAFSPGGELVAIGGVTCVSVRSYPAGDLVATLPGSANSLGFLEESRRLVTFGRGVMHLWRTDTWQEEAAWPEGPGPIAISPDRRHVAIATGQGVRLCDSSTWREERLLPEARGPLAFSPDGATLATDSPRGIELWPLAGGEALTLSGSEGIFTEIAAAHFQPSAPMAFTADGTCLLAAQNGSTDEGIFFLRGWDARTGEPLANLPRDPQRWEHKGPITAVAISADGRHVATTSLDHSVRVWDWRLGRLAQTLEGHRAEVGGAAFTPDGSHLVTCDRAGKVTEWAIGEKPEEKLFGESLEPLGFSADGRQLAALIGRRAVQLYDAATLALEQSIPLEKGPEHAAVSILLTGPHRLLAQALAEGGIRVSDLQTGEAKTLAAGHEPSEFVALTPDGESVVFGSRHEPARIRRLVGDEETALPFTAARAIVSPGGSLLAAVVPETQPSEIRASAGSIERQHVVLWDLALHRARASLTVSAGRLLCSAFSSDGRYFAAAGTDDAIRIWKTQTGELLGVCEGHKQFVRAIAFSSDGTEIASASEDSTWRLWNVETQRELFSFEQLGGTLTGVLFSPNRQDFVVTRSLPSQRGEAEFLRAPWSK